MFPHLGRPIELTFSASRRVPAQSSREVTSGALLRGFAARGTSALLFAADAAVLIDQECGSKMFGRNRFLGKGFGKNKEPSKKHSSRAWALMNKRRHEESHKPPRSAEPLDAGMAG